MKTTKSSNINIFLQLSFILVALFASIFASVIFLKYYLMCAAYIIENGITFKKIKVDEVNGLEKTDIIHADHLQLSFLLFM